MDRPIGLIREASDGNQYQWLGGQWAKYNTKTQKASQIAKKDIARELNSLDINLESEKKASLKAFENKMLGTSETEKNQFDIAAAASKQVDAEQAMVQKMANAEELKAKPQLSEETQDTAKSLKRNFSDNNMARMATQEMRQTPEIVKKIMGEDYKDPTAQPASKKATKIDKLATDDPVVDILSKILALMQKSYDEDKTYREEQANYEESRTADKNRKDQEMLKSQEATKKGKGDNKSAEKLEKDTGKGPASIPIGLALLAGGSLMALLASDKNPEQTSKGIINAGSADGGTAESIIQTAEQTTAIERKKENILANRPSEKKSMLFWKDGDLQTAYLKEIGWDDKTGTTKVERDGGIIGIDSQGKPIKQKMDLPEGVKASTAGAGRGGASAAATDPRRTDAGSVGSAGADGSNGTAGESASSLAGPAGSSGSSGAAGSSATAMSSTTSTPTAGSDGSAGVGGATGASGASGGAGASATPAMASAPTATPVPSTAPSTPSTPASTTSSSMSAAAPVSIPNLGSQLTQATGQNMDMKMDEKSMSSTMSSIVNNMSSSSSQTATSAKSPIPTVRNQEQTFQRMIYNSTRVV